MKLSERIGKLFGEEGEVSVPVSSSESVVTDLETMGQLKMLAVQGGWRLFKDQVTGLVVTNARMSGLKGGEFGPYYAGVAHGLVTVLDFMKSIEEYGNEKEEEDAKD